MMSKIGIMVRFRINNSKEFEIITYCAHNIQLDRGKRTMNTI